ncbi:protein LURP-one-related 15-like [Impatiens glandulifera]|uniref:protein LURP-one-related 15-like n=1 Tax=Impatiens glandulifera TaxID=253017 RepID=UPI001FB05CF5|nr:protein LURP-one-related 15-like [Impatiens glandulifera]
MAEQVPVVGPEYCISDHPVELGIVRKALALTSGNFKVTDVNDNDLFKVKVKWSLHDRRILHDTAGNPIITLRQKIRTMHSRWQVFRGDSHDKKDLLFTTVTSSCLQFKIKLNVFLVKNEKEEEPDFRLKGSFSKGSCIIYTGHGNSKSIIAQVIVVISTPSLIKTLDISIFCVKTYLTTSLDPESKRRLRRQMSKKTTLKSVMFGKDNFRVTVNPNVDYVFIIALVVILDNIDTICMEAAKVAKNALLNVT